MNFTKIIRYLTAICMVGVNIWNYVVNDYAWPVVSRDGAYLFAYFVGNEPHEQKLHFAVSTDGYNYAAFFKHFRMILRHPEWLDNPPQELLNDID